MATRVSRRRPGVAVARRAARWAKPATGRSPRGGCSVGGRRPGSGGRGATGRDGRTPGSTSGGGNDAGEAVREAAFGSGGTGRDGIGGTGRDGRAPPPGTGGRPGCRPGGGVVADR